MIKLVEPMAADDGLIILVYVSTTHKTLDRDAIDALLSASRRNNEAAGITGMLLLCGRNVIQALEGPADAVDSLFAKIERDSRHGEVIRIIRIPQMERLFPDWSMDFSDISDASAEDLAAVNGFLREVESEDPEADEGRDSLAIRLLKKFRSANLR